MFHIGVATPKKLYKRKKKPIRSTNKLSPLEKSRLTPFQPYTGPRWQIPLGLDVSDQIRNIFQLFETIAAPQVFTSIVMRLKQVSLSNCFLMKNTKPVQDWDSLYSDTYTNTTTWKPPASVTSAIQRFHAKQENSIKRVKKIYIDLYRFTKQIKKLVHCHRIYKSLQNVKNTFDPVTLDVPLKPVYVLDYAKCLCYVYEASTLRKTIENRLLFSDYMFPEPKPPVNLLSNEPFTRGQLFSIIDACRAYGEFSWVLDRFKKACDCRLDLFQMRFKQDLKVEAIHFYFKNQKDYVKDTVLDYFESHINNLHVDDRVVDTFINAYDTSIQKKRLHPYIQQWIHLTKQYYIAAELRDLIELSRIRVESTKLCRQAEKMFGI